ncbi:GNAT family N-acetyltransferase [Halorientalis halophila]|uniref:GNAT family N-acetyltransferase n=1 Tax=Halorientalis halophila TaxID=3108499 RepID=UPI00300A7619
MRVRDATPEDVPAVATVVDAGGLALSHDALVDAVDADAVLVAVTEGRILGALVLEGDAIEAIAVRPGRRDQGIGTALVAAAADRRERLVAEFDSRVRPFWASLGFAIEPAADPGRLRGVRT